MMLRRDMQKNMVFYISAIRVRCSSMIAPQRSTESLRLIKRIMKKWGNAREYKWSGCMVVMER